ncbi:MAG TPA: hypothetical protein VE132_06245 [Micromonosporaceae bacterium]|nr:hypothetical protein [Micromonosporaceae bacterium]
MATLANARGAMVDGERHKDGPAARWRWSGPYLSLDLGYQELGRLPWLAAFLRRAFFLRDFFAISASGLWGGCDSRS